MPDPYAVSQDDGTQNPDQQDLFVQADPPQRTKSFFESLFGSSDNSSTPRKKRKWHTKEEQ